METTRTIINSSLLDGIISLPAYLRNTEVEVSVEPAKKDRQ